MSMSAAGHLDQATLMSCLLAYHMEGHSRRGNSRFKVQKSHIGWKGCQPKNMETTQEYAGERGRKQHREAMGS